MKAKICMSSLATQHCLMSCFIIIHWPVNNVYWLTTPSPAWVLWEHSRFRFESVIYVDFFFLLLARTVNVTSESTAKIKIAKVYLDAFFFSWEFIVPTVLLDSQTGIRNFHVLLHKRMTMKNNVMLYLQQAGREKFECFHHKEIICVCRDAYI